MAKKSVYFFGGGKGDGNATMKNLLGGKGANLADMASIGVPVPAGFTVTTEVCTEYYDNGGRLPKHVTDEYLKALKKVEKVMGKKYGDPKNPPAPFGAFGRPPVHARHDGHGAQHRPQLQDAPGAYRGERRRALCL